MEVRRRQVAILASDLAEVHVASNIADMMLTGSREKAHAIRAMSEANIDQGDRAVQGYRAAQRAIYSSLCELLDGYGGYKLVRQAAVGRGRSQSVEGG